MNTIINSLRKFLKTIRKDLNTRNLVANIRKAFNVFLFVFKKLYLGTLFGIHTTQKVAKYIWVRYCNKFINFNKRYLQEMYNTNA